MRAIFKDLAAIVPIERADPTHKVITNETVAFAVPDPKTLHGAQ
jgi:hypothetical protein